jgi:hypothetical protein
MKAIHFIIVMLLLLLLVSCSSNWHLKQARKHEALAVAKGAVITPDTVWQTRIKEVPIPADSGLVSVTPKVDSTGFKSVVSKNDSLVRAIADMERELASGNSLDQERLLASLAKARKEKSELSKELSKRFLTDSTYYYKADSVTDVFFTIYDGVISNVGYNRRGTTIKVEDRIPIQITKVFNTYSRNQLIGAGILALLLVLAIGFIIGFIQGKT